MQNKNFRFNAIALTYHKPEKWAGSDSLSGGTTQLASPRLKIKRKRERERESIDSESDRRNREFKKDRSLQLGAHSLVSY